MDSPVLRQDCLCDHIWLSSIVHYAFNWVQRAAVFPMEADTKDADFPKLYIFCFDFSVYVVFVTFDSSYLILKSIYKVIMFSPPEYSTLICSHYQRKLFSLLSCSLLS